MFSRVRDSMGRPGNVSSEAVRVKPKPKWKLLDMGDNKNLEYFPRKATFKANS